MADGALGSRGAALHSPYCDDPDNRGLLLIPADELARLTDEAVARGFQVCVHAIGDRANTLTLDTFEQALARHPARRARARLRVEHAQILAETDIPRFRALGVLPSMQATHCTSDMAWAIERLGPERLKGAYAWRSLLETGVSSRAAPTFPSRAPIRFTASMRRSRAGPGRGDDRGWQPEQRMTRRRPCAPSRRGTPTPPTRKPSSARSTPGKRADLIVLLGRRLHLPRGGDRGHPPRADDGRRRDRPRARRGPGLGRGWIAAGGEPSDAMVGEIDEDAAYMGLALDEARRALAAGEVPIGAVVVLGGRVIAVGHNMPLTSSDPTAHAEIVALRRAGMEVRNYRLTGAVLYVSVEPCAMCCGAAIHARLARVVYGTADPKGGAARSLYHLLDDPRLNHSVAVAGPVRGEESSALLREFFERKRS